VQFAGRSGHRVGDATRAFLVPILIVVGCFVASAGGSAAAPGSSAGIEPSRAPTTLQPATSIGDDQSEDDVRPAAVSATALNSPVEAAPSITTTTTEPTTQPTAPGPAVEPATPGAAAAETPDVPDVVEAATDPIAVTVDTAPALTNQSTCRTDLPGAVMTIAMPDISYWCPVYAGGQSVIDAGVATVITAEDSSLPLAASPGVAGTLWITGHRASHGGPFASVPDLDDGAIVTVSDGNTSASYVIVGRSYVEVRDGLVVDASGQATESATLDAVLRPDRNDGLAPRLLLQTCDAEYFRWMIYADLIAG
jgi:sortase (surface protein transpeptidase)